MVLNQAQFLCVSPYHYSYSYLYSSYYFYFYSYLSPHEAVDHVRFVDLSNGLKIECMLYVDNRKKTLKRIYRNHPNNPNDLRL